MSNNPNTVKSQDDLSTTNDGKRSSDVLLSTIEELEKTKKQLECGVNRELLFLKKIEKLEKQLEIADTALAEIEKNGTDPEIKTITTLCVNNFLLAHKARIEIEELNK